MISRTKMGKKLKSLKSARKNIILQSQLDYAQISKISSRKGS